MINKNNYLNEKDLAENRNGPIDYEISATKQDFENNSQLKFFKKLLTIIYKNDELLQAIIDAKVKDLRKLTSEILRKNKLSMGNLKVKANRFYIKNKLYIPHNEELQLYLL